MKLAPLITDPDRRRDSVRATGALLIHAQADVGSVYIALGRLFEDHEWPSVEGVLVGRPLMQLAQVRALLKRAEALLEEIEPEFWRMRAEDEKA